MLTTSTVPVLHITLPHEAISIMTLKESAFACDCDKYLFWQLYNKRKKITLVCFLKVTFATKLIQKLQVYIMGDRAGG